MFSEIVDKIAVKKRILIDDLTKQLLRDIGIEVKDDFSNLEFLMIYDELKKRDFSLHLLKDNDGAEKVQLNKHGVLYIGYRIKMDFDENLVSFKTLKY